MDDITKPCIYCGKQAQYDKSYCYQCSLDSFMGGKGHDVEKDLRARGLSQRHIDQFMKRIPPNPKTFYD